jgi:hypothetical protein
LPKNNHIIYFHMELSEKPGLVIARRNDEAIQEQATTWIASGCALAMTATFETVMYSANVSFLFRRILITNLH